MSKKRMKSISVCEVAKATSFQSMTALLKKPQVLTVCRLHAVAAEHHSCSLFVLQLKRVEEITQQAALKFCCREGEKINSSSSCLS